MLRVIRTMINHCAVQNEYKHYGLCNVITVDLKLEHSPEFVRQLRNLCKFDTLITVLDDFYINIAYYTDMAHMQY